MTDPNVLVCQHGSRHRYAIPRMLDKNGLLNAFYTDTSSASRLGKCALFLHRNVPRLCRQAGRRVIAGVDAQKIYSSDVPLIIDTLQRAVFTRRHGIQNFRQRHRLLSSRMQSWGTQQANIVYSMYYENIEFIRWIKQMGLKSAVDVFISPSTDEIMAHEYKQFPDWGTPESEDDIAQRRQLWEESSKLADLLICPSEWVAEGVRRVTPGAYEKTVVVPYGCSIDYGGKSNIPTIGKILFAGRDPLRKGLQYLAQAATELKSELPELDVRIAGELPPHIKDLPICRDLSFLGQLDGKQMKEEYLTADALVLPALSEGFAGVVAEAIGAGCPVIVTKEAGSPVIHEREGLIIESRDVPDLANAIKRIVQDRRLREDCAKACLKQVPFYLSSMWEARLVSALRGML